MIQVSALINIEFHLPKVNLTLLSLFFLAFFVPLKASFDFLLQVRQQRSEERT